MTNDQPPIADRSITLLLIDNDPIFRLGFGAAIEEYPELRAIAVDNATAAFAYLSQSPPDLVILDPSTAETGLTEQLIREYPTVPVFWWSVNPTPQQLNLAQSSGIRGYCPKGIPLPELVSALRQVASGETYWSAVALPERQVLMPPRRQKWLTRVHQSGLKQIDDSLAEVERSLRNSQLPLFDWLFWSGRKRELLTARWLVNQLPVEVITPVPPAPETALVPLPSSSTLPVLVPQTQSATDVFESTLTKIQSGVKNLTGVPLEIDSLQTQKRQELLYGVLNRVSEILDELRFLQVTPEQLPTRIPLILRDLWQSSTIDFTSRNYTLSTDNRFNLIEILMVNREVVQEDILEKIPFVLELFNYLLFEKPLLIDSVVYRPEALETLERANLLMQNLVIQEANAVMQVILNHFYAVEELQITLYGNYLTSREMARLRNNLSWRYRQEKYWEDPKNIFESQYRLFYLNGQGIKKTSIYASRQNELSQLQGVPWAVTIALEARDAIAPRLQAVIDFVGQGVVYVLTEVIGKGIGLIGRGVILGIGNVLQETRYRKNSERGKQ